MSANVWDQVLARVETKVNRHSFYTWFKPTSFVADDGHALTVRVPNPLFKDWLTKHYSGVIAEALGEVRPRRRASLTFVAEPAIRAPTGAPALRTAPIDTAGRAPPTGHRPGLNPRYTFDTFIVGSSNQFAHAACRAVAEAPSRSYNPLFIYGGVGLGKTHLMHAVGQYVLQHDPQPEAHLHLVRALHERDDQRGPLRPHHRFPRALSHASTCCSSTTSSSSPARKARRPSSSTPSTRCTTRRSRSSSAATVRRMRFRALEERLRSRFEWGLIADIQSPDLETKVAILQEEGRGRSGAAARRRRDLHRRQDQVEHPRARRIADPADRVCVADRPGDLARRSRRKCCKNILDHDEKAVTIEIIQKFVADYYNLKLAELKSRNNSKSVAMPRQIAMYLCKSLTHASLPEIGRSFGGKHHSTVIHSIRKVEDLRKKDADFNSLIGNFLEGFR